MVNVWTFDSVRMPDVLKWYWIRLDKSRRSFADFVSDNKVSFESEKTKNLRKQESQ